MTNEIKIRLDRLVVEHGVAESRERARRLIRSGGIAADGRTADKPGSLFPRSTRISLVHAPPRFVSRGGDKLEGALEGFGLDVSGTVCLDVGASTGGFSDCLLQRGATKTYAVDVGYGQLAWKLRNDPRVVVMERRNIRYLPEAAVPDAVDVVVVDVAFISLKIVIPAALRFIHSGSVLIPLVKPQFEVEKGQVGKGGVVRDPGLHEAVLEELTDFFSRRGLSCRSVLPSPLLGPKGNREFFMYLKPSPPPA